MGAFDTAIEALKQNDKKETAYEGARVVKEFDQGRYLEHGHKGVCATLVTRWMKYKMLENDKFFDAIEANKETLYSENYADRQEFRRKWKKIKANQDYYCGRAKGQSSSQYAVDRLTGTPGPGLNGNVSRKMKEKFDALAFASSRNHKKSELNGMLSEACFNKGCASYMSLSGRSKSFASGHAVGFYKDQKGTIFYFDPNMGEVSFDSQITFKAWWKKEYQPLWDSAEEGKIGIYQTFDTIKVTQMKGVDSLTKVSDAANWIVDNAKKIPLPKPKPKKTHTKPLAVKTPVEYDPFADDSSEEDPYADCYSDLDNEDPFAEDPFAFDPVDDDSSDFQTSFDLEDSFDFDELLVEVK